MNQRIPGSGRKSKIMTERSLDQLVWNSNKKIANKFKCDHSYIVKTLKNKINIYYLKEKQIPDRTNDICVNENENEVYFKNENRIKTIIFNF